MLKSKILFVFTGSIACYKAVNVVSKLVQAGHQVTCVLTSSAEKFIGKATLEGLTNQRVHSDLFQEGSVMGHIHLMREADLVVVAPATANYINKIAHGIADDLASTLFLAHDFDKPFIVVPAMNTSMYDHPITQSSLEILKKLNIHVTSTGAGVLACGEVGYGKMLEPEQILSVIEQVLSRRQSVSASKSEELPSKLSNHSEKFKKTPRVLITGGGTVEPIDSVRSLTNTSTGKTAVQLAEYLNDFGLDITLLLSQSFHGSLNSQYEVKRFLTFKDLNHLMKEELSKNHYDVVIHAAAVSDFSVKEIRSGVRKIPSSIKQRSTAKIESDKELKITLVPNIKLISKIKSYSQNKKIKVIGFKLTDLDKLSEQNKAIEKLFQHQNVEWVVHNDLSQISNDKSKHQFRLVHKGFSKEKQLQGVGELSFEIGRTIGLEGV